MTSKSAPELCKEAIEGWKKANNLQYMYFLMGLNEGYKNKDKDMQDLLQEQFKKFPEMKKALNSVFKDYGFIKFECQKCQKEFDYMEDTRFCSKCGTELEVKNEL